jgi:hypothetical protein
MATMTKEEALTLLQGLGDTAEKIAVSLQAEHITGYTHSVNYCPITLFLKKYGADYPSASEDTIILGIDHDGDEVVMNPPTEVARFIHMFNGNQFPELVRK